MSDFNIQFEEQDQSITLEFEQIGGGAVKSVNGKTGVVVLDASDVGALPSSTSIPVVDATLTTQGAAADAKKTGDEITALKEDFLNSLITDTASGSIAYFPDGADNVPVKSLTVDIEPVQDLHGQDSPWVGGTGKNKFKMRSVTKTSNGITVTANADGTVSLSGTATAGGSTTSMCDDTDLLTSIIASGGTFTMSLNKGTYDSNTLNISIAYKETSSGSVKFITPNNPVTIPQGSIFSSANLWVPSGSTVQTLDHFAIQFEKGSSATTFAPYSNICPISGHSTAKVTRLGKNLLKMRTTKVTANGITIEPDGNGYVNISGTTGSSSYTYDLVDIPNAELTALFAMGGEYTLSLNKGTYNSTTLNVSVSYKETENGSTKYLVPNEHKTVPVGSIFLRASVWIPANTTPQQLTGFAIQLERNDTVTEFAPYQCQTVTIDLGGTRYGGTLDVGTGVLTVERVIVVASESMIHRNNGNSWWLGSYPAPKTTGSNYYDGVISDKFESRIADNQNVVFVNASGNIRLSTKTDYASIAEMYADIGQFSVVYPIASPFTVQLTANEISTLLGQNNIWSDAGTVDVEYRADTKLYIEKLTAPTEDDMVADHAISANSFFMVGNTLYRATTAIASGATITVGTNATKLSLSDALNALA